MICMVLQIKNWDTEELYGLLYFPQLTSSKKKKKKKKKFKLQAFLTSKPVHSSSTLQNLLSIQISISQLILYFSKLIECQPQLSL